MFVAASTDCFADSPLLDAIEKLNDLEFSTAEIALHEGGLQLKPSQVADNLEQAIAACRDTHRLDLSGYSVEISATGEEHYRQFEAICRLAKATKVVAITVPSAELGTPFNEEVEHLRRLVSLATVEGTLVSMRTQIGSLTEDPDTCVVLCDNVKGLGLTLDPSVYICGPHAGRNYDKLFKYVYNVHLRDTSKKAFQVRVGQGELEYSRLMTQLRLVHYRRALTVKMAALPELEHSSELRKLRLLLESLL